MGGVLQLDAGRDATPVLNVALSGGGGCTAAAALEYAGFFLLLGRCMFYN